MSESKEPGLNTKRKLKKTELGELPEEWEVVRLWDVTNKVIDSPHKIPKKVGNGIPFVSVNYVAQFPDYNFYIDYSKDGLEFLSDEQYDDFARRFRPSKGDIIYTKWGTPGVAKLINTDEKFIGSCSTSLIKPNTNIVYPLFLVYALNSNIIRKQIIPFSKTSTRTEIHIGHIKKIKLPLPPLPEQRRIAKVLSEVDAAIEKTEGEIKHTERLKKGLMQKLLTRGIGHKKFKDTELGCIPEEWEVVRLGDVINKISEIVDPAESSNMPFVGLEHIPSGENSLLGYGSSRDVRSSKFRFKKGDILYGKLRPYLDKAIIAPLDGICSTDILVLRPKDNTIPEFILYLIHTERFISFATAAMTGTNHPRVNWRDLGNFKLPFPPLPEQREIVEILSAVDKKLELLRERRGRLERVKKGLMNDLLTGRKRVPEGVV